MVLQPVGVLLNFLLSQKTAVGSGLVAWRSEGKNSDGDPWAFGRAKHYTSLAPEYPQIFHKTRPSPDTKIVPIAENAEDLRVLVEGWSEQAQQFCRAGIAIKTVDGGTEGDKVQQEKPCQAFLRD